MAAVNLSSFFPFAPHFIFLPPVGCDLSGNRGVNVSGRKKGKRKRKKCLKYLCASNLTGSQIVLQSEEAAKI